MTLYDYKCAKCGHIFEIQQKITDEPLRFCPECKGPIKRLISASGIIFKGAGFHVTDYTRKEKIQPQISNIKTNPKSETPKAKSKSEEVSK